VSNRRDLKKFLRFPWKVQGSDPAWVPPLLIDIQSRFNPKYPFYEHGEVASYLACRTQDGPVVGRICAIVNRLHNETHKDKVGFFGFFESENDPDVAVALLEEAADYLRSRGCDTIRGPMNFSINDEIGMLIDGFDTPPTVMSNHNPPYYNELMQACGFVKANDLLAYEMSYGQIDERVLRIGAKLEQKNKLRIRNFNKHDFWGEVDRVFEVYNNAWEANWGFIPMSHDEIKLIAQTLRLVYDPRLVFFAENEAGKPVGFCLSLPDINVIVKKMNGRLLPLGILKMLFGLRKINRLRVWGMGVHRDYRGRGIDTVFYCRTYKTGTALGFNWGEFSWILEDNKPMNDMALAMGSHPYKRWRIWEKQLT
jgi:GNAT superfamily N-acetyltransferase